MSRQRYFLSIENLAQARGQIDELSFQGNAPESFAAQLQAALREPTLWERWRALQPDPDAVDPALGASDPAATVQATQKDLHTDIVVTTNLPHTVLKHRLGLLVGSHWRLHDVVAA
jgi:hypothetical protein